MSDDKKMVVCDECGGAAVPYLMVSVTDEDGQPCWLCEECYDTGRPLGEDLGEDEVP